jgi:putative chitinase
MNLVQIKTILKNNNEAEIWGELILKILPIYQINTQQRIIHFLTQICYESNYCNKLEENLNYSSDNLIKNCSQHFSKELALEFGKNPDHVANPIMVGNIMYCHRLGNGDIESGDGYKYRGRGLIQLTGKINYQRFSQDLFNNDKLVSNPDIVMTDKEVALNSSCWFWKINHLNLLADEDNLELITKRVNGSVFSLENRQKLFNEISNIFKN